MQVERMPENPGLGNWAENMMSQDIFEKSVFQKAEEFNQEKLEAYLEDPGVKEVHVFKATPRNMLLAELREKYPDSTRRELRKVMKQVKKG